MVPRQPNRIIERNDLRILNFVLKIYTIVGLVPFKSRLWNLYINTLILLIHIVGMGNFFSVIVYRQILLPGKTIHSILTRMIFFSYVLLLILSSWGSLRNRKSYIKLIKNLERIEILIGSPANNYKLFLMQLILYLLNDLSIKYLEKDSFAVPQQSVVGYLLNIYKHVFNQLKFGIFLVIYCQLKVIMNRYKNILIYLKKTFMKNKSQQHELLKEIYIIKRAYFLLAENMFHIQTLFQMQSVCLIIHGSLYILICFNSLTSSYMGQASKEYISEKLIANYHVLETIACSVSMFLIISTFFLTLHIIHFFSVV